MKTVALVEDNPDNMDLVTDMLEDRFELLPFNSALDLLAYLGSSEARQPDIFVLDISLPQMDGITLMRKLREDNRFRSSPMLALTAHAMVDDRRHLLDAGFDEYLSKPIVDDEELIDKIETLIALRS